MANQQQQPQCSMKKSGFSPEETSDLVTSKVELLLLPVAAADPDIKRRIESRRDNVIQFLSYSISKDGNMHKSRCSTEMWQKLGVIPAPTTDAQKNPGPKKISYSEENLHHGLTSGQDNAKKYIEYLAETKAERQQDLWEKLEYEGKLPDLVSSNDGDLQKKEGSTTRRLSDVDLCGVLDEAAKSFVKEFVESNNVHDQKEEHVERRNELNVKNIVLNIIKRINVI